MKQLLLFVTIIFTLSSCSRKVYFQDATPASDTSYFTENDDVSINTYFAGDAVNYIIFEIDVKNKSDRTIYLDQESVFLRLMDDVDHPVLPLTREILIEDVYRAKEDLKRQKRRRNAEAALGIGINILSAIAIGDPGYTLDAILYSTESAAYAFEGNRAYALLAGSLEEQIEYINTMVLANTKIEPGESQTWDLLFDIVMMDNACKLELVCMDKKYEFDYELFVGEMKSR